MKKTLLIILSVVAALSMVSCKNNKKNQNQEPTQEEIQALADSVLVGIDRIAEKYIAYHESSFEILNFKLDEAEKMVRPDYLLDPSEAKLLITREQKINALAIYFIEMTLREIYDMPIDEVKETIARLAMDINYPLDFDYLHLKDITLSERIKAEYDKCRKNDDLALFWRFHNALITEIMFILIQNPDLFLNKITDDQWNGFMNSMFEKDDVIQMLAKYDEEIAGINNMLNEFRNSASRAFLEKGEATLDRAKQDFAADKDAFAALRNSLLQ